jgi:hypothetical protein
VAFKMDEDRAVAVAAAFGSVIDAEHADGCRLGRGQTLREA